jgi:YfiH family protein
MYRTPARNSLKVTLYRYSMKQESCAPCNEFIVPELFSNVGNLVALQTTRAGGISPAPFASLNLGRNTPDRPEHVAENTRRLCRLLRIEPDRLAGSDQVHGTRICNVLSPGFFEGYDALVTNTRNIYLCIFTADCFPVLLFDPETMAVAAIHAGWKGTAGGIAAKTVGMMQELFGSSPENLLAWIGTGISQAAYEIDSPVAKSFSNEHLIPSPGKAGKFMLDLAGANRSQLLGSGLLPSRIECSVHCSARDEALFYSYRRDEGRTGRMASIIGITGDPMPGQPQ